MSETVPTALPAASTAPDALLLRTERFVLRPLRAEDAETIHRLVNDWGVVRMLSRLPFPYPRTLTDEWIASTAEQMREGRAWHLGIMDETGDAPKLLGCLGLRLEPGARTGDLGYWVGRRYWNTGVAREAAGRFARWALANLEIDRLTAQVAEDNPASASVLRRIGFRETGSGRQPFLARGGEHPVLRFEATRADLSTPVPAETTEATPAPVQIGSDAPAADEAAGRRTVLVSACALVDLDGRVLLARRPEGKAMAGLWEFPGGKVHPGETPEAALVRELAEELGIDVAEACLAPFTFASHAYAGFHLLMPLFLCRRWKGVPVGREGQALAWVRPDKLSDYAMPDADKPLVPLLRDFL
ncbi:bifunctional GNAT family N-acetyltransferase/(deoxy)nucleoside triphosphate pyrophosphohydrolase [Rhizosaccharibacter radicis]|uniref:bifunctional GNAT family N-acetyltransferase/(deoxy)nucleoside triphosphate pyrophosphohydrolase n=1 Tax=Rhizosaccharibacter radicis TaxID=2782605 RepID=UPI003BF4A878